MLKNRLIYLAAVLGCVAGYLYYRQWLCWILLLWLLALPPVSLLCALPAMLTARFRLRCPRRARMGQTVTLQLQLSSRFPVPPYGGSVLVKHRITGETQRCGFGKSLPTEHCGTRSLQLHKLYICDYLGLFRRRIKAPEEYLLTVEPELVQTELSETARQHKSGGLRPKPGGGFSEEQELRLYRPGDDLRQIHWKLSAKTGRLIYRETMEPRHGGVVLTVVLWGAPGELDRKLGRLFWLSEMLLKQAKAFRICCVGSQGAQEYPVDDSEDMENAKEAILSTPKALQESFGALSHTCLIGGGEE